MSKYLNLSRQSKNIKSDFSINPKQVGLSKLYYSNKKWHMKKLFGIARLFILVSILAWACSKSNNEPVVTLLADEQPTALASSLETVINAPIVVDATVSTDIAIVSYPSFITTDYFGLVKVTGEPAKILDSNALCLNGLEVTKAQKEKLTAANTSKQSCMEANRLVLNNLDRELEAWAKSEKARIIAAAKFSLDSVLLLYNNGSLTLAQKAERNTKIELSRNDQITALKGRVQEKLTQATARLVAAGKIKNCEELYLNSVKEILSASQYEKWIKCQKEKYKRV